jgi:hypothetical protein
MGRRLNCLKKLTFWKDDRDSSRGGDEWWITRERERERERARVAGSVAGYEAGRSTKCGSVRRRLVEQVSWLKISSAKLTGYRRAVRHSDGQTERERERERESKKAKRQKSREDRKGDPMATGSDPFLELHVLLRIENQLNKFNKDEGALQMNCGSSDDRTPSLKQLVTLIKT